MATEGHFFNSSRRERQEYEMNNELIERVGALVDDEDPMLIHCRSAMDIYNVLQDCKAALAQQQEAEPVAWRNKKEGHRLISELRQRVSVESESDYEPLYLHPPNPAAQQQGIVEKYNELLYHVARKFQNETRHETALRYIKDAEAADAAFFPCPFCRYRMETDDAYGCPNCLGEGFDGDDQGEGCLPDKEQS